MPILSSPTFFYTLHGCPGILPVEWLGLWNQRDTRLLPHAFWDHAVAASLYDKDRAV
jgi:hypothetical protein